ncbi:tRNA (adenosine(37)-N6)-threonylcarbamoyltransferase complex dimerization subunit type 1 TsaB [Lacisediminimonas sp.]|uniref:tRNA (adenosine(37)-N6)-threonylcarbamoyltransferase complex dimerization subunit type 1 TsaB n=1 Tax=Lacisediminimonas sp. TaxID=3060582 RepID=UPI002722953A|nr:tRNA (adenosine(37)-N6)-threonylcarbamoyltransferase complex dimerization subunit type 1 TsaB [Lacisediminimonas sp.]MDO8299497.1 tRNA (adenosine(37)-N6)-threonylcarbamoyltransferase complex dimerization subunit type 1 TsaB [Lacisediminimonas sp.]MDO9216775.1 tRNA (adenosine(37)-N6)-threonylcarbamoyltransferase complex dimerization subunit type 1 TsaB [Lacisediminimonas sp.]
MTIVLAFETSSEVASVALLHDDRLITREATGVQTHSQTILPMAQALLAEAGIRLRDCDAIAFGCGPGSFTGVRTACGIVQGLAYGAGLPVVPVVTLLAMAHGLRKSSGATDVLAVLDARMGEVYWAQYRFDHDWHAVSAPTLSLPADIIVHGTPATTGNGLVEYADSLPPAVRELHGRTALPHAAAVAELGRLAIQRGQACAAIDAQPLYLRNKIALTTAERLAKAGT